MAFQQTEPVCQLFWEVRQRLSKWEGIAMLDNRLIIPSKFRQRVLQSLHSAHQGCTGMQSRASEAYIGLVSTVIFTKSETIAKHVLPTHPVSPKSQLY